MDTSDIIQQLKNIKRKEETNSKKEDFYNLFPSEVVEISVKDNKVILELSDGKAIESNKFKTSLTNDEVVSIVKENIDKLDLEKHISIKEVNKIITKSLTEDYVKDLVKKHTPKFELDSKEFVNVAKVINESVDQKTKALEKKIKPEKNIQTIRQDLENLYKENGLDAKFIKNLPKLGESKQMVKNSSTKHITQLKDVDPSRLEKGEDGRYLLGSGTVKTIVAGKNITVDNTDIYNPIVNSLSDRYRTTSTDTNDIIPTGQLTFTVDTDLAYIPNQDVLIDASSDNYMNGTIVSYNDITGELVVDIKHKHGSGTFSNWDINLDGITVSLDNYIEQEFETVSKNLKSFPSVLGYTGDNLTSITYTTDTGTIIKTLNYTGDNLTSIVLSGDTPNGIDLTKTLSYVGDNLTNITYA